MEWWLCFWIINISCLLQLYGFKMLHTQNTAKKIDKMPTLCHRLRSGSVSTLPQIYIFIYIYRYLHLIIVVLTVNGFIKIDLFKSAVLVRSASISASLWTTSEQRCSAFGTKRARVPEQKKHPVNPGAFLLQTLHGWFIIALKLEQAWNKTGLNLDQIMTMTWFILDKNWTKTGPNMD